MTSTGRSICRFRQSVAIFVSASLLWTSGSIADAALQTSIVFSPPPSLPQFELKPPPQLAHISDHYNHPQSMGGRRPLVILIQDLHSHYGVQKNIAGVLDFLAKKIPSKTELPFALAVEGADGTVDSTVMATFPDRAIKERAADYLMREGELTGAEYFAVMRGLPKSIVGVEDGSTTTSIASSSGQPSKTASR
jgi:hypothetical protein